MRGERRVCLVSGSPRLPSGRHAKSSVEESGRSIRRKRLVSSAIENKRTRLLDGHRGRHAWRLWVREEKGSSSNRPELAAFFLALRDTLRHADRGAVAVFV